MSCCRNKKNHDFYRSFSKTGWTWFCKKCGRMKTATKGEAEKQSAESSEA